MGGVTGCRVSNFSSTQAAKRQSLEDFDSESHFERFGAHNVARHHSGRPKQRSVFRQAGPWADGKLYF